MRQARQPQFHGGMVDDSASDRVRVRARSGTSTFRRSYRCWAIRRSLHHSGRRISPFVSNGDSDRFRCSGSIFQAPGHVSPEFLRVIVLAAAPVGLTLTRPSQRTVPKGEPVFRIGADAGTRIELWGASFGFGVTTQPDIKISAGLEDLRLVIAPGDGDGFLAQALAAAKIEAEFDLGLVWSQRAGLAFTGGGGLIVDIPLRAPAGPGLSIPRIHGEVELSDDGVRLELSADVNLDLGPFAATVRRMGLQAMAPFAADDRDTAAKFAFKPPSGISLAINSPAVSGGGMLEIDVEKGRYAGALELSAKSFRPATASPASRSTGTPPRPAPRSHSCLRCPANCGRSPTSPTSCARPWRTPACEWSSRSTSTTSRTCCRRSSWTAR